MNRGLDDDSESDPQSIDSTGVEAVGETTPVKVQGDKTEDQQEKGSEGPKRPKRKNASSIDKAPKMSTDVRSKPRHSKARKTSSNASDPNDSKPTGAQSNKKYPGELKERASNPFPRKPEVLDRSIKKPAGDNAALSMRYACLAEGSLAKDNGPYRYTRKEYFAENGVRQDDGDDNIINEQSGSRIKDAANRQAAREATFLFNPDAMMYFTEADLMSEEDLERVVERYFETSQVTPALLDKISKLRNSSLKNRDSPTEV